MQRRGRFPVDLSTDGDEDGDGDGDGDEDGVPVRTSPLPTDDGLDEAPRGETHNCPLKPMRLAYH